MQFLPGPRAILCVLSERWAANGELAKLALTDSLTGLPNRRAILNESAHLFALAERELKYLLVGVVDLDGFKLINDTYGHLAGDQFLRGVADKLQHCLRASDILGRTGGDEFVVFALGDLSEQEDLETGMRHTAELLQKRLTKATTGHYELGHGIGDLNYAGASVGVVAVMPESMTTEDAIKLADRAMYYRSQAGTQTLGHERSTLLAASHHSPRTSPKQPRL